MGGVGILALVLFSALAFRVLEDALRMVFDEPPGKRRFWVSATLPYLFIGVVGAGMILISFAGVLLDAVAERTVVGRSLAGPANLLFDLLSPLAMWILYTALYKVLPITPIALRRAMLGGALASVLWFGLSQLAGLYFAHVSVVGLLYGSLATAVVLLLVLELWAVILLYGAEVIALLEQSPGSSSAEPLPLKQP